MGISKMGGRGILEINYEISVLFSFLYLKCLHQPLPTEETKATISTPQASDKYFSAIAPAATRPIVSRALLRPPPLDALIPYLWRYYKRED